MDRSITLICVLKLNVIQSRAVLWVVPAGLFSWELNIPSSAWPDSWLAFTLNNRPFP